MAATPKVVTVVFSSPDEVLEYHEQHLSKGGVVIEKTDAHFGQMVQVHLDLDFCGKTQIVEGMVVSATDFGTALQVPELPPGYLALIESLQRGEVPGKEEYEGTVDPDESSFDLMGDFDAALKEAASLLEDTDDDVEAAVADSGLIRELDGDWVPPWGEDEEPAEPSDGGDGFSGAAAEVIDEPPPAVAPAEPEPVGAPAAGPSKAVAEVAGEHITLGSGVTASGIFNDLPELSEEGPASVAATVPVGGGGDALDSGTSEAPTVAISGSADASSSFDIVIEDEDSEEFEFDGESMGGEEASYGALVEPIYATVQPAVQLGWAQPVADSPSDLQGKVEGKVINDVVRQLSSQRLSGVLRMKLVNRLLVGIWFEGRPVHFIVSPPEDGKGAAEALAALPEVRASAFEQAMEQQQRTGGHLGILLLEMGAIKPAELSAIVRLEAQKYASTLPMRRGGTFGFWECDVPASGDGRGPDMEALLRWEASVFG